MSTFDGYVKEFPTIRIDHFRKLPDKPSPVVGLLSHVHSDHLLGLESWGKIPLYCSPATRELLLRVEKYPHRMNFTKGILESRKQHYKALKDVLKPIPLNTPTSIEVGPQRCIRVTLFDANHCTGAVMFLIEDAQKAILYTGDIRSESWWVNSLARHPTIIPYTFGTKKLDKLYLDTTFATRDERHRKFPSKATGIKELLEKVSRYPQHTVFHFHAWTLGYEDVWIALSGVLESQVHVDDYKYHLYSSLAPSSPKPSQHPEGPALIGFKNGNHFQKGCITSEKSVRLHSCERGTGCPASASASTVYISPIISRGSNDEILPERGAAEGRGDLIQNGGYLELNDETLTKKFVNLCDERAKDPTTRAKVQDVINKALRSPDKAMALGAIAHGDLEGRINLNEFVENLIQLAGSNKTGTQEDIGKPFAQGIVQDGGLPSRIQFPYSRHSSYEELCELVAALQPLDIFPCTTDWHDWAWEEGVESLFGHLCSGRTFAHDQEMADLEDQRRLSNGLKRPRSPFEFQTTSSSPTNPLRLSQATIRDAANSSAGSWARQGNLDSADEDIVPFTKQRIAEVRHFFELPFKAVKEASECNVSSTNTGQVGYRPTAGDSRTGSSQPHMDDGDLQELALYRSLLAKKNSLGTQAEPIEVSDDGSLACDSQDPSNLVLQRSLKPKNTIEADGRENVALETQVSLSDVEFESQLSELSPRSRVAQVRRRKHAYTAARDSRGAWAEEHSLVSLSANHSNDELEL